MAIPTVDEVWADFNSNGSVHEPHKLDIRRLLRFIQAIAEANGMKTYPTKAAMDADTTQPDGQAALIYADPASANNYPTIWVWDDGGNEWVQGTNQIIGQIAGRDLTRLFADGNALYGRIDPAGGLHLPRLPGKSVQDRIMDLEERLGIGGTTAGTVVYEAVVTDFGADPTGSVPSHAAIQAATDYVAGLTSRGRVYIPPGTYLLDTALVPKDGVSWIGAGWGKTILKPRGAIGATNLVRSIASPLTDCAFQDFEIDGSLQTGPFTSYIKGIFIQHFRRCLFDRLYIHDTGATGLGIDFARDSVISRNLLVNCGRLGEGDNPPGCSGIGIGTGGTLDEPLIISQNICRDNKNFGIFFEWQNAVDEVVRQNIVAGNLCTGNKNGIGDCGVDGLVAVANQCLYNIEAGMRLSSGTLGGHPRPGKNGLVSGNIFAFNQDGIYYDCATVNSDGGYTFEGNKIFDNSRYNIAVQGNASAALAGLTIRDNECDRAGSQGILLAGAGGIVGLDLSGNRIKDSTGPGIRITAPVTRGRIAGNLATDSRGAGSKTQTYGLSIASALAEVDIAENTLRGNATAAVELTGSIGTGCTVGRNPGYNHNITGTPEGAVTAPVGTVATRADGGAGSTLYVKESGTGSTGWAAK